MTQEDKELLIKDLCARLPYGIKTHGPNEADDTIWTLDYDSNVSVLVHVGWRPYLRPMSNLIEKELDECRATCKYRQVGQSVLDCATPETIDYLISHHFDYRGLIPMGLALKAPKDMYKNE